MLMTMWSGGCIRDHMLTIRKLYKKIEIRRNLPNLEIIEKHKVCRKAVKFIKSKKQEKSI